MNANRLVSMILRKFMRRAAFRGIRAGLDHAMGQDDPDQSPQQRRANRKQARKVKQAMRLARRNARM